MKSTNVLFFALLLAAPLNAQTTIIGNGSNWRYHDLDSEPVDLGADDWNDLNYGETWPTGNAHLGYGDGDEVTVLPDSFLTIYVRHIFTVVDPSIFDNLSINLTYDDGAVVYLNGSEVWRINMPGGVVGYNTFASGSSGDDAQASMTLANSLQTGNNIIAVEIHQRSAGSSDISFDLELEGLVAGQANVIRGPYLQKGSNDRMIVRWRTDVATESVLSYGTSIGSLSNSASDLTPKTEHSIELTGLSTNTKYYYEVANSAAVIVPPASDMYFKTAPFTGSTAGLQFWILGDCGTANADAANVRDAYYAAAGSRHTDGILFLGDNAYNNGTDAQYQNAIFNIYGEKLKNSLAWSCLGNHDGISANSNSQTGPYYDIFTFPTAGECGGTASSTEAYYSFDYGNVHFVILDSHESSRAVNGTQYNWCLSDLQNTTQDWIVALWHHPPYTKGSHNSDTEGQLIQMRENFLPMLEANGVDLVLNGHSHSYERSYLLNGHYGNSDSFDATMHTAGPNGDGDGQAGGDGEYFKSPNGTDPSVGTVYITAGSSGKISGGSLDHEAMHASINSLGSGILNVSEDRLDLSFIDQNGSLRDYFTILRDAVLPIDLTYFRGSVFDQSSWLNWKSASEYNAAGYEIEHSLDGEAWVSLTFVEATAQEGSGNSYEFLHQDAGGGTHFYRLKKIDLDGAVEYSDVITLRLAESIEISVSPNPTTDYLLVQGEGIEISEVQITDFGGKVKGTYAVTDAGLDVSALIPGVYLIFIETPQGRVSRHFIKR